MAKTNCWSSDEHHAVEATNRTNGTNSSPIGFLSTESPISALTFWLSPSIVLHSALPLTITLNIRQHVCRIDNQTDRRLAVFPLATAGWMRIRWHGQTVLWACQVWAVVRRHQPTAQEQPFATLHTTYGRTGLQGSAGQYILLNLSYASMQSTIWMQTINWCKNIQCIPSIQKTHPSILSIQCNPAYSSMETTSSIYFHQYVKSMHRIHC